MQRERRKSYRERYFENYQAVKVPRENGKGFRTEYRYIGLFSRWESDKEDLKQARKLTVILELAGILLYVPAMFSRAPLVHASLFNGFGLLSLIPWLAELYGAARFALSRDAVPEMSGEEISHLIRIGSMLHILLGALSLIAGEIQKLAAGQTGWKDLPAFLAIAAGFVFSWLVRLRYSRFVLVKYHNVNGTPGNPA